MSPIKIPYERFKEIQGKNCVMQMSNARQKPEFFFRADRHSVELNGKHYLSIGSCSGPFESESANIYEISLLTGPKPKKVEYSYENIVVLFRGRECVLGKKESVTPLVPASAFTVSIDEVERYLDESTKPFHSRNTLVEIFQYEGIVIAKYEREQQRRQLDQFFVKTPDGALQSLLTSNFEGLSESLPVFDRHSPLYEEAQLSLI